MPANAKVSAIQMASGPSVDSNLLEVAQLIDDAVRAGAEVVVLPENFAFVPSRHNAVLSHRETEGDGPVQVFLAEQARKHGIWLIGGTVPLKAEDPNKIRAACPVYDSSGRLVARYEKIHLFDVQLVDSGERYTESMIIEPGEKVVVIDTPCGRLGIAVGYDLRFPELFRSMLEQGAEVLVVPAQFTVITGKAHWETLLRARAIENLCYVIAAAQGGFHLGGRKSHGNSMIVDPWGVVVDRLPSGSGFVSTQIDRDRLEGIRRSFPTIEHRRLHS